MSGGDERRKKCWGLVGEVNSNLCGGCEGMANRNWTEYSVSILSIVDYQCTRTRLEEGK